MKAALEQLGYSVEYAAVHYLPTVTGDIVHFSTTQPSYIRVNESSDLHGKIFSHHAAGVCKNCHFFVINLETYKYEVQIG